MADKHIAFKHWRCTKERVEKFISEVYFADVNLYSRLYPKTSTVSSILHYAAPGRISYDQAVTGEYKPASVGDSFGPAWSTHWFKIDINIPDDWSGEEVHLRWNSESEAMVWINGVPKQGLTGGDGHQQRTDYVLTNSHEPDVKGTGFTLYIEMAANGMFGAGNGLINPPDPSKRFVLKQCEIVTFNKDCFNLLMDLRVLIDIAKHLPEGSPRAHQALYTANEIVNCCIPQDQATFKRAHEIAKAFFSQRNGESQHQIHAMGHCHIDTAWLWPYAETIRKCARSWATAVKLMKEYPNFTFTCSQAQQFEWVKEKYPNLYTEIKEFVKKGQFLPVGGTWVEMDGNIPSGESFIRQFLIGQKFFKEEFGITCKEFWLPDTFGYSAQLPQILQGVGIEFFLTQKLSWSLINKFPYHTFWWEGLDGSRCLAHFPPGDTYESEGTAKDILKTVDNLKDKGRVNSSVLLYGHGDGGGGPAEYMLEMMHRMQDVDGIPRVKMSTPQKFFNEVKQADGNQLCTWSGELYLELHQGTFTTQAKIKDMNRRGEFLLRRVELISAISWIINGMNNDDLYPSDDLLYLWKLLLLNQFHDVLPGSCIQEAVKDALTYYLEIQRTGSELFNRSLQHMHKLSGTGRPIVFNSLSWSRKEVVCCLASYETTAVTQTIEDGYHKLMFAEVGPMGFAQVSGGVNLVPVKCEHLESGMFVLENEHLKATLDKAGRIVSLLHKSSQREAISPGCYGNQYVMFEDIPLYWDAWDIMPYYLEKRVPIQEVLISEVRENGPLRCSVLCILKISASSALEQVITLDVDCPYLKVQTEVHWFENRRLLKVEFPVNVHTPSATYEIQFGHLQRPTHCNTSWDWAKYEVCGHKWMDLSEFNWGVSLLTDNKYGYSAHSNLMMISLLKSPKAPDDTADMDTQEFTYAVFPHTGSFQSAGVIQQAYNLNEPLVVFYTDEGFEGRSFLSVDHPGIVIETVKKAESIPSAIVVRLYESFGGRAEVCLTAPHFPVRRVQRCNLLEEPGEYLEWKDGGVSLSFKPFQIQTLILHF